MNIKTSPKVSATTYNQTTLWSCYSRENIEQTTQNAIIESTSKDTKYCNSMLDYFTIH